MFFVLPAQLLAVRLAWGTWRPMLSIAYWIAIVTTLIEASRKIRLLTRSTFLFLSYISEC